MANKVKVGLIFPKWSPIYYNIRKFEHSDYKVRYKHLRNSSSAFISRKDVREFIFTRDNYKCTKCGSTERLQIDHIESVSNYAYKKLPFTNLNNKENLSTLCISCNSSKLH